MNGKFLIEHVKRPQTPFNMPARHYHDQFEIYYLLNGERFYFIENTTYHVKKGDIVLISKNLLHKTNTTNKHAHERILLLFEKDFLNNFIKISENTDPYYCFNSKQNVYSLDPDEQLWIENHLFNIIKENQNKDEWSQVYIKILIMELLIFLNRIARSKTPFTETYTDHIHGKISEIASFVNSNYNDNLSLKRVADLFNYSPTYLSKIFKEVTGFNFVEYKNNVRIKEASKLLLNSKLNITEIASRTGYNNLTHFGRIFKKITGYSPLEYKKMKGDTSKYL